MLERTGRRWWLLAAALLSIAAGVTGSMFSTAGMLRLVGTGLSPWSLLTAEIPRAVALCLWPGLFGAGIVVGTAPAWSSRPLAVLSAAAASWAALDSGVVDYLMIERGRGEGARHLAQVWFPTGAFGLLAYVLFLEHRHGRGTVIDDDDPAFPRIWRGGE